jgi:NhaP-type Na+/H+ or K+/H+ antiporter
MGSRPEGVLGHPSGMITVFFAVVMFVITIIVAAISLIVMAVRLKKKEKEEA